MKEFFRNAKVGDEVITIEHGTGFIFEIKTNEAYPIHCNFLNGHLVATFTMD